ncbi:hypothetical protein MSPP1_003501 [Malassezia sp. CBS 17886]|nr:hypothetical protein MSPP1_003501 [Malassezia sp. CBS 17886]
MTPTEATAGHGGVSQILPVVSIAQGVDQLCSDQIPENSYNGIAELADAIDATHNGVFEASRALRKQLKHGGSAQQKRALTVMEGLVELASRNFQLNFADEKLAGRIKYIAHSLASDAGVRRKLMLMLLSWHRRFLHDVEMAFVSSFVEETITAAASESIALFAAVKNTPRRSSLLEDEEVHLHVGRVLSEQKQVVNYIHTVNDEEFLARLVQANDMIIDVLQRVQLAAADGPLLDHALGTEQPRASAVATHAAIRLTEAARTATSRNTEASWHMLSREIDTSLMNNSGLTSGAPSRRASQDYDTDSDGEASAYNTGYNTPAAVSGATGMPGGIQLDAGAVQDPASLNPFRQ